MKQSKEDIEVPLDNGKNDDNHEKPLDYDTLLGEIGEIGPYQILVGVCSGLFAAYGSFIIMNFVFISTFPDHRYDFGIVIIQIGANFMIATSDRWR